MARFVIGFIVKLILHTGRLAFTLQLYEADEDIKYGNLAIFHTTCHVLWLAIILIDYYDVRFGSIWLPWVSFLGAAGTLGFDLLVLVSFIRRRFRTDFYAMILFWAADSLIMAILTLFGLTLISRRWVLLKVLYQNMKFFWMKHIRKSKGILSRFLPIHHLDLLEIHTARLDKLHFIKAKPYDWVETRTMRVSDEENKKYT